MTGTLLLARTAYEWVDVLAAPAVAAVALIASGYWQKRTLESGLDSQKAAMEWEREQRRRDELRELVHETVGMISEMTAGAASTVGKVTAYAKRNPRAFLEDDLVWMRVDFAELAKLTRQHTMITMAFGKDSDAVLLMRAFTAAWADLLEKVGKFAPGRAPEDLAPLSEELAVSLTRVQKFGMDFAGIAHHELEVLEGRGEPRPRETAKVAAD